MTQKFENIKKILIPTDGSEYSIRAAEYGLSIAKMLGAEVIVLYVLDTIVLDQIVKVTERETADRELKQDGQRYINYILNLAEKQSIKAASLLLKGRPFEQVLQITKGLEIDLIVMGTYGRRGAERILIGSVAEQVIEYATCPVLVIK